MKVPFLYTVREMTGRIIYINVAAIQYITRILDLGKCDVPMYVPFESEKEGNRKHRMKN